MIALDCQHISKSFDGVPVLRDLTFHIEKGSKTALVGVNGAGKTTFLRIVIGEYEADGGMIVIDKDARVGYLSQGHSDEELFHREGSETRSIWDMLCESKSDVIALERELEEAEHSLDGLTGSELEAALKKCEDLRKQYEEFEGYAWRGQVKGVARGLGFSDEETSRAVGSLSGGERMRVSLGCILLKDPDILLLDEPTNHLDISSIKWLENYLTHLNKTVVLISHDRYFLDRIVDTVIEIEYGTARTYAGNYTEFAKKKKKIRADELHAWENQQQEIRHQEAVIKKLHQFNREKSVKRARSREKMLDKLERLDKPLEEAGGMRLSLQPDSTSGNDVLTLKDVEAGFGDRTLFEDVNLMIRRGEHVAFLGDNGTGKTTLLKLITGDSYGCTASGTIRTGTGVTIGYYDQNLEFFDENATLFDVLREAYPDLNDTRIRNALAAFLFTGDDVFKQVKDLSGGEKGRLSLAKLMLSGSNFLILDEPTNHLDIWGKEALEDALSEYRGTLLFVSHDRYFIGQVADRVWELYGNRINDYVGGYEYYEEHADERRKTLRDSTDEELHDGLRESAEEDKDEGASGGADQELTWEEQKALRAAIQKHERDLARCEQEIAELEARQIELEDSLADPAIATNGEKLAAIAAEQQEVEDRLLDAMSRWEELAEDSLND